MRLKLFSAVAGLAMGAFASQASAVDACGLARAKSYAEASSLLERAGCTVSREEGVKSRAFECPAGQIDVTDTSLGISIAGPGAAFDKLAPTCDGASWSAVQTRYDNPLVLSVGELKRDYAREARITFLSLDGKTPYLTWICTGSTGCIYTFDRGLKIVLKRYLGDDTLNFTNSAVRVAGLDITEASRGALEQAMHGRGARLGKAEGGPLVSTVTFEAITGVPGATAIEARFLAQRVASVRYPISAEPEFLGFSQSLDERYGVSKVQSVKGCLLRSWTNGGVSILGEFCSAKPDRSGFIFVNMGAAAIIGGLNTLVATPTTEAGKPSQPKARTDMY